MMGELERKKTMKWALISGAFLLSATLAQNAPAQERQPRQGQQQEQSRAMRMNRSVFFNDALEDLLVIRLAERSNLSRAIEVNVKDGVATLSGKVPSQEAEGRALRIARTTRGIFDVRDQISVDPSMTRAISEKERKVNEKELVRQVAQKIAANIEGAKAGKDWWFEGWRVEGEFNAWNLVVEVDEPGFVILEGDVPSLDIMRKAVEAAAQVPGIRAVDTDLELERYYADYYPYYHPYYPPYAFAPYAWHPPIVPERMAQTERQQEQQQEGR